MLLMKAGQLVAVKLLEMPPSKKLGRGLGAAVAAESPAEVDDADVLDELLVVELASVVGSAVDTEIAMLSVITVAVLFLSSCSSGCSDIHFPSSQSRTLVSIMSRSSTSSADDMTATGVGWGAPSSPGSLIAATAVGSGSSSSCDASAVDANKMTRPRALAQCVRGLHKDDVGLVVADEPQQALKRVNEAMTVKSRRQNTCGTCTALVG